MKYRCHITGKNKQIIRALENEWKYGSAVNDLCSVKTDT